ncbi:MAG: Uncharacterized UPF0721 integral membrane protein [uncultured Thermomicrobiales bacterium]|uniref:Probable membrane transporter protein n=1 Tax=uncultured Thermomicrobiales bacterium TaxID=1645740 RepID=A0A6J4VDI9_9BACT|nr:MAG: Uncharacterized UPF0721 integral membrane protein [uncultured Thermomicrobiales bacterium]
MTLLTAIGLFAAAFGAGALNSVAGGGQFLTFPMLIFAGVPVVSANATSSVAVWPGTVAATVGYRRELREQRGLLLPLSAASVVGGILGAVVLLRTPQATFARLIPWLLLLATLLLVFGGPLVARLRARLGHSGGPTRGGIVGISIVQVLLGIYGGYFGGGMGFVMLAAMAFIGLDNMHIMNGLKTALASCINGVAVATFVLAGAVAWPEAIVMLIGAILGGYGGAFYARRLDPQLIRRFTIFVACAMTLYFFVRQYS